MAIVLQRASTAISDSFLTSAIAKTIKTKFIVADDNTITYLGTSYSNQKELRFVRNIEEMNSNTLIIKAETRSSNGTTNVGIFFDSESNPRKVLSTIGTNFELLQGTCYIGNLLNGVHSIQMKFRNLDYGTSYNKLVEIYEKI